MFEVRLRNTLALVEDLLRLMSLREAQAVNERARKQILLRPEKFRGIERVCAAEDGGCGVWQRFGPLKRKRIGNRERWLLVCPGPKSNSTLFAWFLLIVPATLATIGLAGFVPLGSVNVTSRLKLPVAVMAGFALGNETENVPRSASNAEPPEVTPGPKLEPVKCRKFAVVASEKLPDVEPW